MLVFTRKIKEAIQIGEEIEITILGISGDKVKIGIEAPKNIEIHRKEIYLSIKNENEQANNISKDFLNNLKDHIKIGIPKVYELPPVK